MPPAPGVLHHGPAHTPHAALAAIRARLAQAMPPVPRDLVPLRVDGAVAGRLAPARAARLARFTDVFRRDGEALAFVPGLSTAALRDVAVDAVVHALAAEGALTAWRNERYAAAPAFGAPPWFHVERAAARYLGIRTYAVHANGLVDAAGTPKMWIARRSPRKPIDPDLLDNLVGGGIAAGETPRAALRREAWEEAGLADVDVAAPVATLAVERAVPDGLQCETIFAYDLWLPADAPPCNRDGEVVEHRLVDFGEALRLLAREQGPDVMTVDATRVALDCIERHGGTGTAGEP